MKTEELSGFSISLKLKRGTAQRLSAVRRYPAAVKMGPFPDGKRPQMEAPSAGPILVSLPSTKFTP